MTKALFCGFVGTDLIYYVHIFTLCVLKPCRKNSVWGRIIAVWKDRIISLVIFIDRHFQRLIRFWKKWALTFSYCHYRVFYYVAISIHLTSSTCTYIGKQPLWNLKNKHLILFFSTENHFAEKDTEKREWLLDDFSRTSTSPFFPFQEKTNVKKWCFLSFKSFWLSYDKRPLRSDQAPRTSTPRGTIFGGNITNCEYHPHTRHSWISVFFLLWWKLEAFPQHMSSNYLQPL